MSIGEMRGCMLFCFGLLCFCSFWRTVLIIPQYNIIQLSSCNVCFSSTAKAKHKLLIMIMLFIFNVIVQYYGDKNLFTQFFKILCQFDKAVISFLIVKNLKHRGKIRNNLKKNYFTIQNFIIVSIRWKFKFDENVC